MQEGVSVVAQEVTVQLEHLAQALEAQARLAVPVPHLRRVHPRQLQRQALSQGQVSRPLVARQLNPAQLDRLIRRTLMKEVL